VFHLILALPFFLTFVVKVKQSHYMPGQFLRVQGDWDSQISRQSAHGGAKVVSPTHWPSLPQQIFLVLISVRGWANPSAIMRPEGLCYWKIPMILSEIEPATFQIVAQCLKQLSHRVPRTFVLVYTNEAKFNGTGNKTSQFFHPFWRWNAWRKIYMN
jgi:hypothetical protein